MEERRIPVTEEALEVGKRQRHTGTVRVETSTQEETVPVEADLVSEEVVVHRVPVERYVAAPVADRWQGDTLVVSVIEEEVVVEKRLKLVEEIHITRVRRSRHVRRTASRRRQEVAVVRE